MAGDASSSFSAMSDAQLRQTLTNLSTAQAMNANATNFVAPIPQEASKSYSKNIQSWSNSATPPPRTGSTTTTKASRRSTRTSNLTPTTVPYTPQPVSAFQASQPQQQQMYSAIQPGPQPPRAPIPTTPQALHSSYASRLRTGSTLLVQPILSTANAASRTNTRRGGAVNYIDPGSGDDLPDAGALDSDDSDFVAGSSTRQTLRQTRPSRSSIYQVAATATPPPTKNQRTELDQSYLGQVPPSRFVKSRPVAPTAHEYPPQTEVEAQAECRSSLVPIRVEFETDTHRIRDCFMWNLNEKNIKPENFAKIFCYDLDLPIQPWADTVTNQIRAQLEEHEGVASMSLGMDGAMNVDAEPPNGEEVPECRVIVSIDVQIANHHLLDHIEWDLLSPLTPEHFAQTLCSDLGLTGEALPLIAHAIHEELMKHKKDSVEWGIVGGDRELQGAELKDKTGLGLAWARSTREGRGRGPQRLRSVWRDWAEVEEFRTRFEVLTAEEVERREYEKERASRRLRRETSKFQSSTRTRTRR